MKLTIEQKNLLAALSRANRIVEKRTTIPILSNIRLSARAGRLRLTTTDLDIEMTDAIAADIAAEGDVTAPAGMLHDIARKLPEGAQVSLDAGGEGTMILKSGRARFTLPTLPASDFPDFSAGEFQTRFAIPAKILLRLLGKARFAISEEETRYYLNGVFLHAIGADGETMLRAVATDGHRLARLETPAPRGAEGMPGVIAPKKTVGEMIRLCEAFPDAEPDIELSPTKLRFSIGGGKDNAAIAIASKLIDGTYPDYQRVIPSGNDKRLVVDRDGFAAAVDRVSVISSERGRAVKLSIADGRITLSVASPDHGAATEDVEADYDAPPLEIGFNARYLADICAEMDSDTLLMRLAEPGSPTILQTRDGADALFVLMPMRV